ncbi:MAG: hypothetical protein PHT89_06055 [Lachnospiraceae bacterium]|nr:hypothetical protein [Lachnospiraceae bacterium]MDD3660275.1 hypothetical protein [Lachnospiraceae bacterium]
MTNLLVLKERLRSFYGRNEIYITPALKFLLAFISLILINSKLGYMSRLNHIAIVLVVSLMCSFLPTNIIIVVAAAFSILHLYALSIESAAVVLVLFLVLFVLYFRFTPKDTVVVLLTPVLFILNIPYVIPITMGLVGTPASVVSVISGILIYHIMQHITAGAATLNASESSDTVVKFRFVIDGILDNKTMLVTIAAFTITLILVYFVRRMSIDHAWSFAIAAGAMADVVLLLIGDLVYDTNISVLATILGTVISIGIVIVLQFFVFNVDYSRTERVQFEDDEYYYYVKAVPKITVSTPEKKIKKINPQRSSTHSAARTSDGSVTRREDILSRENAQRKDSTVKRTQSTAGYARIRPDAIK